MDEIPRFLSLLIGLRSYNQCHQGNKCMEIYRTMLCIKGECSVFKKNYVMNEIDLLSEYIKIPLGHNRTNGAVYPKINFKVEIYSAL